VIAPGTRIGVYEVAAPIGMGGMGVVYRARDTNLGRDVAIKVLPDAFVSHPERTARFKREATTLAALNHPNIASIYGLEESDGVLALVLELVEGPTLAEQLASGALAINHALPIAKQIADALEAAHERGIIHRDLKPANIVLTANGAAKVLDFGLAKVLSDSIAPSPSELTHSPTMLGPTGDGVLLGTAPYMSPEQARGKAVDRRTDVWAFGCVLFEMLTGARAFPGETSSDAIAAVLEREPDWTKLPPSTPPAVRRLLRRCLEKDSKRRLRDIGDARLELDDESAPATAIPASSSRRSPVWTMAAVVAATFVVSVAATAWYFSNRAPSVVQRSARFTLAAPEGSQLQTVAPVPSPDGTRIAFTVRSSSGQNSLWIRTLESAMARALPGTEDVAGPPFWSPDGQWVGFFADGRLKKVKAAGGPALTIATIQNNLGATWGRDNVIIVAPVNRTVLHRVAAGGGTPEPISTLSVERRENSHRWPHFLPDGRHFLFTARSDVRENNIVYIGSLDSKEITPLFPAQSGAVYAAPGYILYSQEGTLMAQPVDPRAFKLAGEAFPVAENVSYNTPSSGASFGASADGSVLAYLTNVRRETNLTWFDRTGKSIATIGPERNFTDVRISPDGKSAAVVIPDPDSGNRDIWLVDLASGTLSRFTSNPANDWLAAWSPDGKRIAFASDRNGRSTVWIKPVDGGEEELLLRVPDRDAFPKDFSRDGQFLALDVDTAGGVAGVWAMPLAGERTPFSLSNVTVRENNLTFMPGEPWVAFESLQSGDDEIYVAQFPKGGRRRVSSGGGTLPRWKSDGKELYFLAANDDIMAAPIRAGQPLEVGTPVRVVRFCGDDPSVQAPGPNVGRSYDVTADGARFLMPCGRPGASAPAISVALDWSAGRR
jgi:eukaryotic-like serine/threonine-protein kinase